MGPEGLGVFVIYLLLRYRAFYCPLGCPLVLVLVRARYVRLVVLWAKGHGTDLRRLVPPPTTRERVLRKTEPRESDEIRHMPHPAITIASPGGCGLT